jgi:RecA/RadA recombinase
VGPAPEPAPNEPPTIRFVGSGCAVLDQALGGGWALGRVSNIIGDRSTG